MIVARHPGAVKRATSYAERLRLNIAVIHGEEKDETDHDDYHYLPSSPIGIQMSPNDSSPNFYPKFLPGEKFVSLYFKTLLLLAFVYI